MASIRITFIIARVVLALAHVEQIEDSVDHDAVGLFQAQIQQEVRMKQTGDAQNGALDAADGYALADTLNCRSKEGSSQVLNGIAGKDAAGPQEPAPRNGASEDQDPPGACTLRLVLWLMVMGLVVDGARRLRSQKQDAPAQEHVSGEVAKDHDANANAEAAWLEMVNASASGDTQSFEKALTFSPSIARTDAWACTALHFAATGGAEPIVAELLRRGAEVDARDASNETPLHFAARAGHAEICKALLDARADADAVSSEDMTPLVIAGFANQEPVCRLLADSGAGVAGLLDEQLPPLVVSQVVRKCFAA